MARYTTSVRTDRAPHDVFTYLADLRNFAEWDPGVRRVVQVAGEGGGVGTVFDVTVAGPRDTTLRYHTRAYDEPAHLVVEAVSPFLRSLDTITVVPDGDGSLVTYDAVLDLRGPLRLADPLLKLAFGRIGDRAAAGLRRVLGGVAVPV